MSLDLFPDPRLAGPDGIIAFGGDLSPETLCQAYSKGIFPWPIEGLPLPWFSPEKRGVLFFDELQISKSLKRSQRKSLFEFTMNRAFKDVIRLCAEVPRKENPDSQMNRACPTWITPEMIDAYTALHQQGNAHSVETWNGNQLVGGIYGVEVAGVFSAESMFYLEPDASKLALLYLIDHLKNRTSWMDIQMVTEHTRRFGAREIPRSEFLTLLKDSQDPNKKLFT